MANVENNYYMDLCLLNSLVEKSKMGKARIAEKAKISRTTLDNALNGADIKISTIESLSNVLGVSPSVFFTASNAGGRLSVHSSEMLSGIASADNSKRRISTDSGTANAYGEVPSVEMHTVPIVPAEIAELPDTDVYELVKESRIGSAERLNPIGRYIEIDMYWRVRDDAMMPRFMRDDILALANFPEGRVFPNGSPMVVGTRSCGFVFRRVHDVGDALDCRVANADSGYAATVIPKSQVIRLYRVVGMVRTGF